MSIRDMEEFPPANQKDFNLKSSNLPDSNIPFPKVDDPSDLYSYEITEDVKSSRHFAEQFKVCFRLSPVGKVFCSHGFTIEVMSMVLTDIMNVLCKYPGYVRVVLDAPGELSFPITDSMRPTTEWNSALVLSRLENLLTSFEYIAVHDNFVLNVFLAKTLAGGSKSRVLSLGQMASKEDIAKFLKSRKSLWSAKNSQESCFIQNLAYMFLMRKYENKNKKSRKPTRSNLKRMAFVKSYSKDMAQTVQWIKRECRISSNQIFIAIEDISAVTVALQKVGFNFHVSIYKDCSPDSLIYQSQRSSAESTHISMLLRDDHYWLIKNAKGFFGKRNFCKLCCRFYRREHKCSGKCESCKTAVCFQHSHAEKPVYCDQCNRAFKSQFCYTKHKIKECARIKRCPNCSILFKNDGITNHFCGYLKKCSRCGATHQKLPHVCYIRPARAKEIAVPKDAMYVWYDAETFIPSGERNHQCYLVTAQKRCLNCIDKEESDVVGCSFCGVQEICHFGIDSMRLFLQDVMLIYKDVTKNIILIAHGGGIFDHIMLLKECLHMKIPISSMLCKGSRILSAAIAGGSIKLIDSSNFLLAPLRQLGKFLALPDCEGKTWFPFALIKSEEDLKYFSSCLPDRSYYPTERMSASDLQDFEMYYSKHQSQPFNLRSRAIQYCKNDTNLLRLATSSLRRYIFNEFGIDVLFSCCTIGQAAALIYRRCYLVPDCIPNIQPAFMFGKRRDSKLSITYLAWMDLEQRARGLPGIFHHGNTPTGIMVKGIAIDGISQMKDGKTSVYFVNGCHFHSCFKCSDNKSLNRYDYNRGGHVKTFLDRTVHQSKYLESEGYECTIIWEHDIIELRKRDAKFDAFCKDKHLWRWYHEPMTSRSGLKGGRTEVFHALVELSQAEMERGVRIFSTDVKSQYAYVMLCRNLSPENEPKFRFPLGLPKVYLGHKVDSSKINDCEFYEKNFGLFSCDVLPPKRLHVPCLPVHSEDGRLVFPLCSSCMNSFSGEINRVCSHNSNERTLHGSWTSVELEEAIKVGYTVLRVIEAWVWEESSTELFSGYIQKFLSCKFKNEGYPKTVVSDQEKSEFLKSYRDLYGIQLDPHEIKSNELARYIYKRFCNVLFGKLSESKPRSTTKFTTSPADLRNVLFDSTKKIQGVQLLDEDLLFLQYSEERAFTKGGQFLNDFIASLVTAFARILMVRRLHFLGEQAIYTDTDSITYLYDPSNSSHGKIAEGNHLGQFQSELGDSSHFIRRFIAIGPKAYMYDVWKENHDGSFEFAFSKMKLKGIQITAEVERALSFQNLKQLLFTSIRNNPMDLRVDDAPSAFYRSLCFLTIEQKDEMRKKSINFTRLGKRWLRIDDFENLESCTKIPTYPHGYVF